MFIVDSTLWGEYRAGPFLVSSKFCVEKTFVTVLNDSYVQNNIFWASPGSGLERFVMRTVSGLFDFLQRDVGILDIPTPRDWMEGFLFLVNPRAPF